MMRTRKPVTALTALVAVAAMGGCQSEDPRAVPGDPQAPYQESVMGTNNRIGPVRLLSVHVEAPLDVRYRVGDDARVWLTLLNEGPSPDVLRSVRSPVAGTTQIRWDDDCDGVATAVPALTLKPVQPNLAYSPPGVPPFDAYHLRLVDINREVLAGTTIPLTFTFDRAGTVTVQAPVQPSNAVRPEPSRRCQPGDNAPVAPPVS